MTNDDSGRVPPLAFHVVPIVQQCALRHHWRKRVYVSAFVVLIAARAVLASARLWGMDTLVLDTYA